MCRGAKRARVCTGFHEPVPGSPPPPPHGRCGMFRSKNPDSLLIAEHEFSPFLTETHIKVHTVCCDLGYQHVRNIWKFHKTRLDFNASSFPSFLTTLH